MKGTSMTGDVYHEVRAADIHEGGFLEELNQAIADAHATLHKRLVRDGEKCSVKIVAEIQLRADPKIDGYVEIESAVTFRAPKEARSSMAISRGGRILCQPDGTNEAPDQLKLFDKKGKPVGVLDPATGEMRPETTSHDVVGRVAGTAS